MAIRRSMKREAISLIGLSVGQQDMEGEMLLIETEWNEKEFRDQKRVPRKRSMEESH